MRQLKRWVQATSRNLPGLFLITFLTDVHNKQGSIIGLLLAK